MRDKTTDKTERTSLNREIKALSTRLKLLKGDSKTESKATQSGLDEITGGGSRPTNITVNLGKFMDSLIIQAQSVEEAIPETEQRLKEMLLRVLNSVNQMATT